MTRTYTALLSVVLLLGGYSVATADSFTTVLNVPPDSLDSLVADSESESLIVPSGTQVNLTASPSSPKDFKVLEGGELNYSAGGFAQVEVQGGVVNFFDGSDVGMLTSQSGGQINVWGGTIGVVDLGEDTEMKISGGQVDQVLLNGRGIHVLIEEEGVVNAAVIIGFGSENGEAVDVEAEVSITGGDVFPGNGGTGFLISSKGILDISGGNIHFENADAHGFLAGSQVNFSGYDFAIDGVPLPGLVSGVLMEVLDRDVTLSGRLTDGAPFSLVLASQGSLSTVFAPSGSHVTVTYAIPEPGAFLLAILGVAGTWGTRSRVPSGRVFR